MLLDAPARSHINDLTGNLARADLMHQLKLEQQLQTAEGDAATQLKQDLQDSKDAVIELCNMHSNPCLSAPRLNSYSSTPSFPPVIAHAAMPWVLSSLVITAHAQDIKPPPGLTDSMPNTSRDFASVISRRGPPSRV
ncbi:hypothetical protein OAU50_00985 [Planctomycetota bacterium]|nr:hypothetical protein [Planctomycetota bacterium]